MKFVKKLVVLLAVAATMLSVVACGNTDGGDTDTSGVKKYTIEAKFNSDTINQWKTLYLLDDDTYTLTVYALDSKDNTKVTADFYMTGSYKLEGDIVTIDIGYGYTKALNGDTPIEMPVSPESGAMYYAMIGGQSTSFKLVDDTFEIVTE